MRWAIGLLAITLQGCAGTVSTPPPQQTAAPASERLHLVKLSTADIAAIQTGVRRSLKDPDSARFGTMVAGADAKGAVSVCLMVNAKNSYGGYTGEKPMMGIITGTPRAFVVASGNLSGDLAQYQDLATYKVCSDSGLTLSR